MFYSFNDKTKGKKERPVSPDVSGGKLSPPTPLRLYEHMNA